MHDTSDDDTSRIHKVRKADGTKLNAKGASLVLYGLWKLGDSDLDQPVLLCEGETDCWAAQAHCPSFQIIGVAGVGHQPEKLGAEALAGRTVYLAFDGDEAGRGALSKWNRYLSVLVCKVFNIPMPDGADIASMTPEEVASLPSRAVEKSISSLSSNNFFWFELSIESLISIITDNSNLGS